MGNLLEIKNLKTSFLTGDGEVQAVRGISLGIGKGETVGVVGESGSGKSVTFLSVLRLMASTGRILEGEILFEGRDLVRLTNRPTIVQKSLSVELLSAQKLLKSDFQSHDYCV